MSRWPVRTIVTLAAGAAILASTGTAHAVSNGPAARPLGRAEAVATRLIAQQGLAIALANNVLQVNQILVEVGYPGATGGETGKCASLYGSTGPGIEILKLKRPSKTKTLVTYQLYYDSTCTKPYVTQSATVTSSHGGNDLAATETSTYHSLGGRALGTFTAKAAADDTDQGLELRGVGSFLLTGSKAPVSLGLTCDTKPEGDGDTSSAWHCAGAIAQHFSRLHLSLGSLTPLTLTVQNSNSGSGFGRVDFTGRNASLRSSTGTISVGLSSARALVLTGKSRAAGRDATKGSAAQFAVFTPRPTAWTLTDSKAHTAFSISVVSKSLQLAGKVIDTKTNAALATIDVDRSGSGTITYRGAKPSKIVSWLLTS